MSLYVTRSPATGVSDGSVTADKLAAALANNVGANQTGVTNRSAMTAMTTERTTTSTSFVDVTGASLTFTIASGSYIIVGYNAQMKTSIGDTPCGARVLADTAICNAASNTNDGFGSPYSLYVSETTYRKVGGMAMFSAADIGTGSKTLKWQFRSGQFNTAYIDECYLTVTQVTF